ncbi:hypothetical protein ANN_21109 [Periplaneta americana]|uniref:Uncharacterized protein n=1 Tax=Periplaneta americana TaxID=6978 RepID=A0ABQ8SEK0_PERAM|nr:hypothetical protein ANN_21109 [Periplaneta americana]
MPAHTETWSNVELRSRSVIRFSCLKGTSPAEIHRQLVEVYTVPMWHFRGFHLFAPSKKHCGKRFNTDTAVQQAVMTWFQELEVDFFCAGIDALVYRWNKCLDKHGEGMYWDCPRTQVARVGSLYYQGWNDMHALRPPTLQILLRAAFELTCRLHNYFTFPRSPHRGPSTPVRVTMSLVESPQCIALPPTTNDHISTGSNFGGVPQATTSDQVRNL